MEGLGSDLAALQERIIELERSAHVAEPAELEAALEGLRVSLEELRVAQEDLQRQHDELIVLRELLETERERYVELFEQAPVGYLVTDGAGVVLEANRGAAELLGISRPALAGKPLASFVALAERREFRRLLLRLAGEGGIHDVELTFRPRRGGVLFAQTTVSSTGTPGRVRWAMRDAGEEHRARSEVWALNTELESRVALRTEELEVEHERLESVLDQMPGGVVIAEAPSGRIVMRNALAASLLGWTDEATLELPLAPSLLAGEPVVDELVEVTGADGSRRVLELNAAPVYRGDQGVVAAVAIFHDVTVRERRERAEREFVSNAAHELQTPLTAIASAVEVLQAGAKEVPADRDRFLAHVQDECDRLARLVRALLQLARAETGEEQPPRELVSVRSLLTEAGQRVRPRSGVELDVQAPARLRVYTNRDLAEQALVNLVGNAAKYTAGGSITLSARPVDADSIALEVADTGPGISPADRERVFERFFRGVERSRDGFGLGLAIASQTARVLGGRIEVDPRNGAGTTVRLILPRKAV